MTRSLATLFIATVLATAAIAEPVVLSGPFLIDTGGDSSQLAGGDFDEDGRQDFLVVHPEVSITVHRGRGDGRFEPPVTTPMTQYGSLFAMGHINGDAKLDLVIDKGVFLGNGDGSFREVAALPEQEHPGAVAIGDFTGDGYADVLMHSFEHHSSDETIAVYPGDGTGHFGAPVITASSREATEVVTADLNDDGKLDLVTGGSRSVAWLGAGDGTFVRAVWIGDGYRIALADFDGDGRIDRAATDSSQNFITVSRGNGDGTFGEPVRWRTAHDMRNIAVADMNVDGELDLVAGAAGDSAITILLGRGDGTFEPPRIHASDPRTHLFVTGDYNGDGKTDVVTIEYEGSAAVLRGNGDGTLDARPVFLTNTARLELYPDVESLGLRLADVTGDGKTDAITMTEDGISALPGNGNGTFGAPIVTPIDDPGAYVTGDFTGDGKLDAVVAGREELTLFEGNGNGTFRQSTSSPRLEEQGELFAGDFTGDGKLDIVISSWRLTAYINDGSGRFSMGPLSDGFISAEASSVADVNRDGRADIVFDHGVVLLSDGDGDFTLVLSEQSGSGDVAGVADLDADGNLDIVTKEFGDWIGVRRGYGDGVFAPAYLLRFNGPLDVPSYASPPTAIADMNGDGHLDLVHGFSILFGDGRGLFTDYQALPAFTNAIALEDLDGNGSPDIVALHGVSGSIEVLLTRVREGLDQPVRVEIESSRPELRYGQEVTYTARVTTDSGSILRGAVRFDVDGVPWALAVLDDEGKASTKVVFASVRSHTVTATFLRTDLHSSASASMQQDVIKGIAQLSLHATPNPAVAGKPVTITLFAFTTGGRPTGAIVIRDGDTVLGTIDLGTTRRLTTTFTTLGTHTITAEFPGSHAFEPASTSYEIEVTGGRRRSVR